MIFDPNFSMKKIILVLLVIFSISHSVNGQTYEWVSKGEYEEKNIDVWDINPLEELIYAKGRTLYKLNNNFEVTFTQGEQGFGLVTAIDARHSLNTLVFSEDQQFLGVVDNTLSFQEGKIDLAELSVDYGTHVCYSDQSHRFWVYDEQNSRLLRFDGVKASKKQIEISNLAAITQNSVPTTLKESQNQLLVFYQGDGVFVFDFYGSLLRKFEDVEAKQISATEKYIYFLRTKHLVRVDRVTGEKVKIDLPYSSILDFRVFGNNVYFKDKTGIKKYSLIRKK